MHTVFMIISMFQDENRQSIPTTPITHARLKHK